MTIETKVSPTIVYNVVYQEVATECGEPSRTYGLQAIVDGKVAEQVLDISSSSAIVHNLARKFEEEQLSHYQLEELVDDFLIDLEIS